MLKLLCAQRGFRIGSQRLFVGRDRGRLIAELALDPPEIDQRFRRVRPHPQRILDAGLAFGKIAALRLDQAEHMQRIELLFVGLEHHFIEELGLRDIAGLMGRDRARKYLLRLGN